MLQECTHEQNEVKTKVLKLEWAVMEKTIVMQA